MPAAESRLFGFIDDLGAGPGDPDHASAGALASRLGDSDLGVKPKADEGCCAKRSSLRSAVLVAQMDGEVASENRCRGSWAIATIRARSAAASTPAASRPDRFHLDKKGGELGLGHGGLLRGTASVLVGLPSPGLARPGRPRRRRCRGVRWSRGFFGCRFGVASGARTGGGGRSGSSSRNPGGFRGRIRAVSRTTTSTVALHHQLEADGVSRWLMPRFYLRHRLGSLARAAARTTTRMIGGSTIPSDREIAIWAS